MHENIHYIHIWEIKNNNNINHEINLSGRIFERTEDRKNQQIIFRASSDKIELYFECFLIDIVRLKISNHTHTRSFDWHKTIERGFSE